MDLEEEEIEQDENDSPTNQLTTYKVIQYIKHLRKSRGNCDQTLIIQQLAIRPTINKQPYIALIDEHFYTIYDNPEQDEIIIADGANHSILKQKEIKKRMGRTTARCLNYPDQRGEDHCGSSAILINIELLKLMKKHDNTKEWPETIHTSKGLINQIVSKLHKQKVRSLNGKRNIRGNTKSTRCTSCNKQFKKRTGLTNHLRACN